MTTAALGLIGVSEEETLALFRALAGVLFLGQVRVPFDSARLETYLPSLCLLHYKFDIRKVLRT